MAGAVELVAQAALGDGHPDGVGEALAERAGGRLDARCQAVLGVAGRDAAPLAERLEVLERDLVAGQVEERVEQHAGVAGGQHEPVAIGPVGARRRVAQEPRPDHVGHRRGAHRRARVPGIGLLDGVDRERPDGVDGELVEVGGDSHRAGSDRSWCVGGPLAPRLGHCSDAPAILRVCRRSLDPGARNAPGSRRDRPTGTPRPSAARADSRAPARIVVLGDLMLDVVLAPARRARIGDRRPGSGALVQGGSAATTARWLGRLGARSSLIASVGRDAAGRALVEAVRSDGVTPRVVRVAGARTGRIGVLVAPDGERSFVADRGAADQLRPDDLQAGVVRRGRRPAPAGLLAARASRSAQAGRRGDRAGARGRRGRERRPRLDRAAARRRPPRGTRAHRGGRPGPAVRDGLRGRGAARRPAGRRAARVRGDGRGQARRRRARRSWHGSATASTPVRGRDRAPRRGRHDRRGRRLRRRVPRRLVRGAASARSTRCRRRSSARPWPAIGRRRAPAVDAAARS